TPSMEEIGPGLKMEGGADAAMPDLTLSPVGLDLAAALPLVRIVARRPRPRECRCRSGAVKLPDQLKMKMGCCHSLDGEKVVYDDCRRWIQIPLIVSMLLGGSDFSIGILSDYVNGGSHGCSP
ncbi:hypothetical protein ACLOJK_035162, partial [Asimina triloba]